MLASTLLPIVAMFGSKLAAGDELRNLRVVDEVAVAARLTQVRVLRRERRPALREHLRVRHHGVDVIRIAGARHHQRVRDLDLELLDDVEAVPRHRGDELADHPSDGVVDRELATINAALVECLQHTLSGVQVDEVRLACPCSAACSDGPPPR